MQGMFPRFKRRLSDAPEPSPTVVAEGVTFNGDLIAPGAVLISGNVRGDGQIGGLLQLARQASWTGEVHAAAAVIAGRLEGCLKVTGALELGSKALIRGRVIAKSLAVARGAVIEGDILITSGEPIQQFEEQRGRAIEKAA